jgi:hypothetical protein
MQNVFTATRGPEGHPIANGYNDYAENTDLKHRYTRNWCIVSMSWGSGQGTAERALADCGALLQFGYTHPTNKIGPRAIQPDGFE